MWTLPKQTRQWIRLLVTLAFVSVSMARFGDGSVGSDEKSQQFSSDQKGLVGDDASSAWTLESFVRHLQSSNSTATNATTTTSTSFFNPYSTGSTTTPLPPSSTTTTVAAATTLPPQTTTTLPPITTTLPPKTTTTTPPPKTTAPPGFAYPPSCEDAFRVGLEMKCTSATQPIVSCEERCKPTLDSLMKACPPPTRRLSQDKSATWNGLPPLSELQLEVTLCEEVPLQPGGACPKGQVKCDVARFTPDGKYDFSQEPMSVCAKECDVMYKAMPGMPPMPPGMPKGQNCNSTWEHVCTDSYGSYCKSKKDGACPLQCKGNTTKCFATVFTKDGQPNFTSPPKESCEKVSSWSDCPCDATWENKCKGPLGSFCQMKTEGRCPVMCRMGEYLCTGTAYDKTGKPNFTEIGKEVCVNMSNPCPCNKDWENQCKDRYGSWCQPKSEGECPVSCTEDQIMCFQQPYNDVTKEPDFTKPGKQTCSSEKDGCPCNKDFEHTCTDKWNPTGWCKPKTDGPCPLECKANQLLCMVKKYASDGKWDGSSFDQSCASFEAGCPCDPTYEEKCFGIYGSYCIPKGGPEKCPLQCKETEMKCMGMVYNANGQPDYTKEGNETCAEMKAGCPCDATWEEKCSDKYGSWCQAKTSGGCPLECGNKGLCFDADGKMSCETDKGCKCNADKELTCENPENATKNICLPKAFYTQCPLTCKSGEMNCMIQNFDTKGAVSYGEQCVTGTTWEVCDATCGTNSQKCVDGSYSWCQWDKESCPLSCKATEQMCYVMDFTAAGAYEKTTEKCANATKSCPCGANTKTCKDPSGSSFCIPSTETCPVVCDEGKQKTCAPISFTTSGSIDWSAAVKQSCVLLSQSCPCGANAKACKWTDEFGISEDYCIPKQVDGLTLDCPIQCSAGQEKCWTANYNATGFVESFKELCTAKNVPCACGTNSQRCTDETGFTYCLPKYDSELKQPISCPLVCQSSQKMCDIPSFDSSGALVSSTQVCVDKAATCDCTKGQNAVSCTQTWGGETFTECLPRGSYCPVTCQAKQVPCPTVADYDPKGSFLRERNPVTSCAASYKDCGCGREAQMCSIDSTTAWCQPKIISCPLTCKTGEKECLIVDYDASGTPSKERAQCKNVTESCPCGKNADRCPGSEQCLSAPDRKVMCPCKSTEIACDVEDYSITGTISGMSTLCITKGGKCPCGKNTLKCPDPNDANVDICIPKASKDGKGGSCPMPCTAAQEKEGNRTCRQMNLDPKGNYVSEAVSCLAEGACTPGANMKKCPSGSIVSVASVCEDLYGTAGGSASTTVSSDTKQTSTMAFTLNGDFSDSKKTAGAAKQAKVGLTGNLQLPPSLKVNVVAKAKSGSRRLADGRMLSAKGLVVLEIKNEGGTKVSPKQVTDKATVMVKTGNKKMTAAMKTLGTPDPKAGVSATTKTATVKSRKAAAAAIQKKQTAAKLSSVQTTTTTTRYQGFTTTTTTIKPNTTTTTTKKTTTTTKKTTTTTIATTTTTTTAAATTTTTTKKPKPVRIVGQITLSVSNPAAFVKDEKAKKGIQKGIANHTGVLEEYVKVTLSVTTRRLSNAAVRRLQAGSVLVSYEINLPANVQAVGGKVATGDSVKKAMEAARASSATLNTAIEAALKASGTSYTVLVTAISAVTTGGSSATTTKAKTTTTKTQAKETSNAECIRGGLPFSLLMAGLTTYFLG
eukprot:TRINITY_DN1231_c0_g1_i2.p1 TRINITY_DN1231_c0_g1~~TRINITY_DN1231_c0_g1_i2.p1  ORF type:complete len:1693 (+),score=314.93 TRINITY_DN1231_c0_g1_i2:75-5153(+)